MARRVLGRCVIFGCRKEASTMTNKGKTAWAAPKLQRLSAKLAEGGPASPISDSGNNNKS